MKGRVWLIEWRPRPGYAGERPDWQLYWDAWATKTEAVTEAKNYSLEWHQARECRVVSFVRSARWPTLVRHKAPAGSAPTGTPNE